MVALDNSALFDTPRNARRFHFPQVPLAAGIGLMALGVMLASLASRDFSENGLRLGTLMTWRFASLVFFAALVAGPVGRLVRPLRFLADQSHALVLGFCAAMTVYFASIVIPNLIMPVDGVRHEGLTFGMLAFVLFGGALTIAMAVASSEYLCRFIGARACRTMLGLSAIYFWLCYALVGLAHMSGPHRPDAFYGFSVCLMVAGLLVRFADRYAASLRESSFRTLEAA